MHEPDDFDVTTDLFENQRYFWEFTVCIATPQIVPKGQWCCNVYGITMCCGVARNFLEKY